MTKAVYMTYKEWCSEVGMKAASQQEFSQRLGGLYEKKPLRWKMSSGWRSQQSFVDVQFKSDAEFGMNDIYHMNVTLHCK